MKLKSGDQVKIVKGKDKGKSGKIERVFAKEEKVFIANINQYKRHQKGKYGGQKSEIVTITKPLPFANVQLICPKCSTPTRIGYSIEDGKKVRVCKKCDQNL